MSHNHASPPRCSLQSWCDPSTGTQAPNALWGTWTGGAADRGTCTQIALTTQARARAVCPLLDRRRAERRNPPGLADGGCVSPHRPSPDLRSRRLIELDAGPCPRASIPRAGKKKKPRRNKQKNRKKKKKKENRATRIARGSSRPLAAGHAPELPPPLRARACRTRGQWASAPTRENPWRRRVDWPSGVTYSRCRFGRLFHAALSLSPLCFIVRAYTYVVAYTSHPGGGESHLTRVGRCWYQVTHLLFLTDVPAGNESTAIDHDDRLYSKYPSVAIGCIRRGPRNSVCLSAI